MKTRPILFSGAMVRALLNGTKTQTRRAIKPLKGEELDPTGIYNLHPGDLELERCPYGKPGDVLWARETFIYGYDLDENGHKICTDDEGNDLPFKIWYAASDSIQWTDDDGWMCNTPWKPSIHMPRWASRLTLVITDVRVERLKSISGADAIQEGIERTGPKSFRSYISGGEIVAPTEGAAAIGSYLTLWSHINGEASTAGNPWVYAIDFEVHRQNVDEYLRTRGAA